MIRLLRALAYAALIVALLFACVLRADAGYHFADFRAATPIRVYGSASRTPSGMTPAIIKKRYGLPSRGGRGTIAIISAYDDASIETDLATFDAAFGLPSCTSKNSCFEKHGMAPKLSSDSGWALETTLDVEWAHAIAPDAKILLVEATTQSGTHLIQAVDYVALRPDVVSVSMSWGGAEFPEETSLDAHFLSAHGAVFFASAGDSGAGASWPAASPNVIGVGGTSFSKTFGGGWGAETAWSGSGGGVSTYEKEPGYQKAYAIPRAGGMRAIPDVAYDADPRSGFPIVRQGLWHEVGGTSAGAPQWAAIAALDTGVSLTRLYADKASAGATSYFYDIASGKNGSCAYFCTASKRYDYVTGLGSPRTSVF